MPLINNDPAGRRTVRTGHLIAAAGITAAIIAAALLLFALIFLR
ncbi:hypothetical protein [Nucisporomicrobium flavum]|nr:hypothetical protein [Nucisporomicrobium flavum]